MRVILFTFWGRERAVAIQLPFIRRILEENPNVEFEGWNLARKPDDAAYLQTLSDEFTIRNDFYQHHDGWNAVWRRYAQPQYADATFLKIDDDVPFIETNRFGELIKAVEEHPESIVSAQVVNNGACTPLDEGLWERFTALQIPPLDVHLSNAYAQRSHEYFFENWRTMVGQPVEVVPTDEWLSINAIAFDHSVAKFIGQNVGSLSPAHIAGRDWQPGTVLGDEGAANTRPRYIVKGCMAGHVSYGPQHVTDEQWDEWLTLYEAIGREYLK